MDTGTKQSNLKNFKFPHYYGDSTRKFLLFAGVVILIAILRDTELMQLYFLVGILTVVVLTIVAGMTSPKNRGVIVVSNVISAALFILFEYFAVINYAQTQNFFSEIFFLRQLLALTFLVSLYYSTKTLREMREE